QRIDPRILAPLMNSHRSHRDSFTRVEPPAYHTEHVGACAGPLSGPGYLSIRRWVRRSPTAGRRFVRSEDDGDIDNALFTHSPDDPGAERRACSEGAVHRT